MKRFNPAFFVALTLAGTLTLSTMRPSLAVQEFTTFACATAAACVIGNNSGTGPGMQGISKSNAGVTGSSSSGTGVRGTSSSASGVVGTTSSGTQAILGQAVTTTGVSGKTTTSGTGVLGLVPSGVGVSGNAHNGIGVSGNGSTGVFGSDVGTAFHNDDFFANGFGANGFRFNNTQGINTLTALDNGTLNVFRIDAGSGRTTRGNTGTGSSVGLQGFLATPPPSGPLTFPKAAVEGNNTGDASTTAFYANSFGGNEFVGNGSNGVDNFIVDNSGNVHAHSFTNDLAASTRTPTGATISTYSQEVRTPTIEDFGEATLAAGHAYVHLDPTFADALSRGVPYYVFVTPLGPTRGMLYVSQRTLSGFYVHESGIGGSTVAFDYRIVGKRYTAAIPQVFMHTHASKVLPPLSTFPSHPKSGTRIR